MNRRIHSRTLAMLLVLLFGAVKPALAQMSWPLQVIFSEAPPIVAELTLADLDALDQAEFTTSTIWTDGTNLFSGVPLKRLLAAIANDGTEIGGRSVEMVALNEYKIVMPLDALEEDVPIIATRVNGETISVREKGPYWVVFPYDKDPKYRTEAIYSYSVWQLNQLKIVD